MSIINIQHARGVCKVAQSAHSIYIQETSRRPAEASMRKAKNSRIPDLTEFTDEEGKRWIQTSTEDLFSVKELNEILESSEKDRDSGEIILARIDFKKVNREYYETVRELQAKLKKRNAQLKTLILETRETVDRKNKKLKELIEYIKKLHLVLACYKLSPDSIEKLDLEPVIFTKAAEAPAPPVEAVPPPAIEYSDVEEVELDEGGEEVGAVSPP